MRAKDYKLHVGQAPYETRDGTVYGVYQLVRISDGHAIASVSLKNGKVERSIFGDGEYCRGTFVAMAQRHFREAKTARFWEHNQRCPDWVCNEHLP